MHSRPPKLTPLMFIVVGIIVTVSSLFIFITADLMYSLFAINWVVIGMFLLAVGLYYKLIKKVTFSSSITVNIKEGILLFTAVIIIFAIIILYISYLCNIFNYEPLYCVPQHLPKFKPFLWQISKGMNISSEPSEVHSNKW